MNRKNSNTVVIDGEVVGIHCFNFQCPEHGLVEFDDDYGQPCGFQGCERKEKCKNHRNRR